MKSCVVKKRDKIIPLTENKRELMVLNPSKKLVEIGTVDNCLIKGRQERCDYYVQGQNNEIFFIELKGSNVKKAVAQIVSTVRILSDKSNLKKVGIIVCSRSPKQGTDFQLAKARAKRFCDDNNLSLNSPKSFKESLTIE